MKLQLSLFIIFAFASVHIASQGFSFIHQLRVESCDNKTLGICSDCGTSSICNNDAISMNNTCSSNQECLSDGTISYCSEMADPSSSECGCPPDVQYELKCDKYDNHKYIICLDGDRSVFTCEGGQVCINNECREETDTTTTPAPGQCVDYPSFVTVNCTAFIVCIEEGVTPDPIFCDPNEIVSEEAHDCVPYEIFSCEGLDTGIYEDPHNCSVYHTCSNGEEPGDPQVCPEGSVYNPDTKACEEGGECTVNECTPCTTAAMTIGIDCIRYFQCHSGESGKFYTTVEECPEGLYFDAENGYCDIEVDGCP